MKKPIPPEVGKIEFKIVRKKQLLGTTYDLYIDFQNSTQIILSSKKIAFKGVPYYIIFLKFNENQVKVPNMNDNNMLGKLK